MKTATLAELGPAFPYLKTPFTTKPWRGKEERAISLDLGRPGTEQVNARVIATILSVILENIQGTQWKDWDLAKRKRHILEERFAGDGLYAYCYVRRECVGNLLAITFECPACGEKNNWKGDLDTLEVKIVENESEVLTEYKLRDGIDFGGKKIDLLIVRSTTLASAMSLVDSEEEVALHLIRNSCSTKEGFPLADPAVDLLSKRDIQALVDEISNVNIGPNFRSEVECGKCKVKITAALDLWYEPFFDTSSPSSMRTLIVA